MRTRKTITFNGKSYEVDNRGFLLDPAEWDEDFARCTAPEVGILEGLTEAHWRVIKFIRNTFETMESCPLIYVACKQNELGLGELKKLFPTGYLRGVCKLAGVTYRQGYLHHVWQEHNYVHHQAVYEKKSYETDEFGFLKNPDDWDEKFAVQTAYELHMSDYLTKDHWMIVNFLRERYESTNTVPTVYETCEANRIDLNQLQELFPNGYHRGAVKIAGLQAI